jgi:flagellar biosynthetic protein FliR
MQLAIPIVGVELMTEIPIGFMMRVVPQINIFVVSFQIKLLVGMAMILLLLSPMAARVTDLYEGMFDMLYGMIGLLH